MKAVGWVLLVLCLVCVVAFSLELLYLLWCRRRRNRSPARSVGPDPEQQGRQTASDDPRAGTKEAPSSSWLCLLCRKWKRAPTRIEPSSSATSLPTLQYQYPQHLQLLRAAGGEYGDEDAEVAKARGQFASRELFTIREEEEGVDTDSAAGSGRRRPPPLAVHSGRSGSQDPDGATPYATPCGSPQYLTPVSSPPHPSAAAGCL